MNNKTIKIKIKIKKKKKVVPMEPRTPLSPSVLLPYQSSLTSILRGSPTLALSL
jgi:hypothetical protein